jgi:hypothetical protein
MFADELRQVASQYELTPERMRIAQLRHLALAFQDDVPPKPRGTRSHMPVRRADDCEDQPERNALVLDPKPVVRDWAFTCLKCGKGRPSIRDGYACPACGEVGRYAVRAGAVA